VENEIQPNISPVQSLPQTSVSVSSPTSTHWSKILLFTILGLVVITSSVFIGIQIGKNQTSNQQPIVVQPATSPTQLVTSPTITPTANTITDSTANWKTYTSERYTLRYPGEWIVDEKCTKLGYPASNPCMYSPDYQPVTKKIEPGEGGIDTITEYNIGTLLNIDLLDNVAYDSNGFCSPGGPASIENCHERTINENRYALREIGSYPYPTTSINAWLLKDTNGVADLSFSFSKTNKITDLQVFDQILSSFKFVK
jgi:hypothetical protein